MQLVSDLQQRPRKGRLRMEKRIVSFYDLCSIVQLATWLAHTVQTTIGAHRTFTNSIFVQNRFSLTSPLLYKTQGCVYNSTRSIYAFRGVRTSFTPDSINDVFVDDAIQMRLAIFIMAVAFAVGSVNRMCVEANFFVLKKRNFYFWKDIISAVELLLLSYVFVIAVSAESPAGLLRGYLKHCNVESEVYLPFVPLAALYTFGSVGFATYAVGLFLYLHNSLPKYGIMTPAEIDEYKEWLRARKAEKAQSRAFIEQAKQIQARLMLLQSAEYPTGTGTGPQQHHLSLNPAAASMAAALQPMYPPIGPLPPQQQLAMAASGAFPYLYPYPSMEGLPQMAANPNLPPPQRFGMQPGLATPLTSGMRGMQPPPPQQQQHLSAGPPPAPIPLGPPLSVNMPRRRNTVLQRPQQQQSQQQLQPGANSVRRAADNTLDSYS